MNIVFFGTSDFALAVLHRLIGSKHKVLAVVTQPDRQRGRSLKISPSPTKVLAQTHGIPVHQPLDASDGGSVAYLKRMNADLFVVVAFGQILKKRALEIPRLYAINVHGSLLPKYRGAAPTNWAIINGERVSGVTVIKMNEKMDEGDIILKKEMPIDAEDTNITLTEKLSDLGADALIEAVAMIDAGKAVPVKQDPSAATYAPKLGKEDGLIDWNEPAVKIHNKVRALLPWPGAYTRFDKKILKILKTEVMGSTANGRAKNGEFLSVTKGRGMVVRTGDKDILVQRVQIEGKKPMDSEAFLRGHSLRVGYVFN